MIIPPVIGQYSCTVLARGLIQPRPQSGYYVRSAHVSRTPEPRASTPGSTPRSVNITSPVLRMLREMYSDEIVGFGSADPPEHCLPTDKLNRLSGAIARRTREGHGWYDAPPGQRDLRTQVARLMTAAGCTLDPETLITTVGCQEAVTLCLRTLTRPGDLVAIESPTFYGHLMALEMLGLRAVEIPTNPATGVDLDAFASVVRKQKIRTALFVTNGHNPLGYVMSADHKRKLHELLEKHDVALVEDDIYGDICFDTARPTLVKSLDTEDRRVLEFQQNARPRRARRLVRSAGQVAGAGDAAQVCQHHLHANALSEDDRGVPGFRRI